MLSKKKSRTLNLNCYSLLVVVYGLLMFSTILLIRNIRRKTIIYIKVYFLQRRCDFPYAAFRTPKLLK